MTLELIQNWLNINELQAQVVAFAGIMIIAFITYLVTKHIFLHFILKLSKKTKTLWDDKLVERKVFHKLSYIIPLIIIYYSANLFPIAQMIVERLSLAAIILFCVISISSLLSAVHDIYITTKNAGKRPIKGYLQIISIFFYIIGSIIIIGIILGKSPWIFVSGLGAMTAILLLIFKDTILSLMASLQISFNDLIKIGDWLSVPQYNADGDVIDVALHTVKIQNWDKTISIIPTHKLIESSFINWRGMQQSGGRRMKRAINIDLASIKFCDEKTLRKFEKFRLIQDYLRSKKIEIEKYNNENKIDTSELINGRNLTNIGTFRAYISAYLRHHPKVKQNMTFLIRQLPSGPTGLPIEIYVFLNDIEWANYEAIQADIFDHIFAIIPEFELRIFQYPTGFDLMKIK